MKKVIVLLLFVVSFLSFAESKSISPAFKCVTQALNYGSADEEHFKVCSYVSIISQIKYVSIHIVYAGPLLKITRGTRPSHINAYLRLNGKEEIVKIKSVDGKGMLYEVHSLDSYGSEIWNDNGVLKDFQGEISFASPDGTLDDNNGASYKFYIDNSTLMLDSLTHTSDYNYVNIDYHISVRTTFWNKAPGLTIYYSPGHFQHHRYYKRNYYVYIRANGKEHTFKMSPRQDYGTGKVSWFLQLRREIDSDLNSSYAVIDNLGLLVFNDQGTLSDIEGELAFYSPDDGQWDSKYGVNYKFYIDNKGLDINKLSIQPAQN